MYRGWVANTDYEWYEFLRGRQALEEVNFWRPSPKPLSPVPQWSPFFFKLKSPHSAIGGFGLFGGYRPMPLWFAWECFGEANGAPDLPTLAARIEKYRSLGSRARVGESVIGCLMVEEPVFFPPEMWVEQPRDWKRQVVPGSTYDLTAGEGLRIWKECSERVRLLRPGAEGEAVPAGADRYGPPILVRPRRGQGLFRVEVTEAYGGACAVTKEHSLPVLEAAHIKPYAEGGIHEVSNGILLRADLHRLFDKGYVTVTPEGVFEVSRRLKEKFENGRSYYPLGHQRIQLPDTPESRPSRELLEWHNANRFLG